MLIDTHAHLTMEQYTDLDEVIKRASENGVLKIINASFDIASSEKGAELSGKYENLFFAAGIHPHHAETADEEGMKKIRALAACPKAVAIGETGLDHYENPVPKEVQRRAFEAHLSLAAELGLPVILHGRDAGEEMLDVIKATGLRPETKGGLKGVFHCFSEDEDYARKVFDLGFLVSFTAIITFKNASKMREVVKYVPLDRMMLETDCPYLAPQIFRGSRNEPSYVRFVAEKLAEIKGIPVAEVEKATTANAEGLFKLK